MQGDFKTQTHDLSRYKNMEKQLNKVLNTDTLKQATKSDYVTKIQYTEHRRKTGYNYLLHNCTRENWVQLLTLLIRWMKRDWEKNVNNLYIHVSNFR